MCSSDLNKYDLLTNKNISDTMYDMHDISHGLCHAEKRGGFLCNYYRWRYVFPDLCVHLITLVSILNLHF